MAKGERVRHLRQRLVESWRPPKEWDFAPRRGGSNVVVPVMTESACVARARHGTGDPYDPQAAPPDVATAIYTVGPVAGIGELPAQASKVLVHYVVDDSVEVTLESRPGRLLPRESEADVPEDGRWLLGAAVSTMRMLRVDDEELTAAAEAAQRQNIEAMCDPALQEIPLEPDGEPSAENFRWWHRKWMYDRCRDRLGDDLWAALGLPTWEELSRIIPRQPSYGPADGRARLIHGDIKSANLVPVNGPLARVLARHSTRQPFYNALRDETIGPLAEESLAYLDAMRREHGDGLVQDMVQRVGGLYEPEYREFAALDPAARLERLVAQLQRLARADLEADLSPQARLTLAPRMDDVSTALAGSTPLQRLHHLSAFHARHEQASALPDRCGALALADLERSTVALVDHDLALLTHNPRSMTDLAVLIRLSAQWSQEECEAAVRDRGGLVHRDELERELLDYAWRSVVNDIMRATEGRVPIEYAVNAVVDFRARAGLVPWADHPGAVTATESARHTRDLSDEVTALLRTRIDLNHPDQPLAPFRLPATLREHLRPNHPDAAPTVRLNATQADRDEARRLNDGREPEAGLVAACAVRRHEHARTAQRAAARTVAATLRDRMAAGAFRAYQRAFGALTAHRERNGIPTARAPFPLDELAQAQPTTEHVLDAATWDAYIQWQTQTDAGSDNKRRVFRTTRASVARQWLRRLVPGRAALPAAAVDLAMSVTPGLSPTNDTPWKADRLPRTPRTRHTQAHSRQLRNIRQKHARGW